MTNNLYFIRTVLYIIDPNSSTPMHIQLYDAIKEDISTTYSIGDKLPSIRKIAAEYNLSKTTVESAYGQLYAEGYVESQPKRGYFVADFNFDAIEPDAKTSFPIKKKRVKYRYDFTPVRLSNSSFPLKLWKRLSTKALNANLDFGLYQDGQGDWDLRVEIARYLISSRGVNTTAEEIVICHGFSDAMSLVAKLCKSRYKSLGMEQPGYYITRQVFAEYGYDVESIQVGSEGMSLKSLQETEAKLLYITPSHQYPTGVTMPISNRQKLLEYIDDIDGLIIEDDYDSELRYESRPIPALQGLDSNDRVVYFGTFSKSLSPVLRMSYLVLPRTLMTPFRESYDANFARVSLPIQKTMAYFMAGGHYEKHLRKIRTLNKKRHNLMRDTLREKLGSTMHILSQGGGLAILIHPSVAFDWERFKTLSEREQIKVYLAKERSGGEFEAIRMGFGGFAEDEIVEAVEAFSVVWYQCII